jgi:teichoic acid ribitol-phosphate primase
MRQVEYRLAALLLSLLGRAFDRLAIRERIVLATARHSVLEGNLAAIHAELRRSRPRARVVLLLEPYGYGLRAKLAYLVRVIRGLFYLRTSSLVVIDNAYLPVHVGPHRRGTTVVQVWHAVAALKRFGADTTGGLAEPERTFLHRYYDFVVCAGERSREPYARALRTPVERVLPLGVPRTDALHDPDALAAARARVLDAYPVLRDRRVVLYAPTFRGRGRAKQGAPPLDGRALRAALPADQLLVLKTHPNLDPARVPTAGFDVVVDPTLELNDVFAATDVLVTDYSSSIFEWALLRRPLVLLTEDLEAYERDPGLYLDPRTDLVGTRIERGTDLAAAIVSAGVDPVAWDAFIAAQMEACDGRAAARFVERFVPA